ncbi:MAG: hypothetical protein AB7I27_19220 [Bacteriovoracaceae bacterium]
MNGRLVGGDDEIIDCIQDKILKIVYHDAIFNIKNISSKHYSKYLEIVSYWIFLNISQLIQLHMDDFTPRISNEFAAFIVNKVTKIKMTKDAFEKASIRHIHLKAHGGYFDGYYYERYRDGIIGLKIIKYNKKNTIKKTSRKNLKNVIALDICDERFKWSGSFNIETEID